MKLRIFLLIALMGIFEMAYAQCDDTEVSILTETGEYGYEMSWQILDITGNVVAESEVDMADNSDFFVLECLMDACYEFVANDSYGDGWNGGTVSIVWDSGTELFELPNGNEATYYFGINNDDCVPEILGCTDPDAINFNPDATVDDGSCMTIEELIAEQEFDTLHYGGPKDNRINFVIQNRGMPDAGNEFNSLEELVEGLSENYLPAFEYGTAATKNPYAQYKDFFNLYAAYWPDAPGQHTWWTFDILHQMRDALFLPWANDETGWVTWFSSSKYGGGGGAGLERDLRVGSGLMFGTDYETLLHEFGHTMPGLLDEYTSSGVWSGGECWETPNTTAYTIKDSIPWRNWLTEDAPLPTPYNGANEDKIGAFEGALTNYFGCHRPTANNCYMGAGGFGEGFGDDLCPPCVQRVICYLYKYVDVIENPTPAEEELEVLGDQTLSFSADVLAPSPNTQKYEWFLNGKLIESGSTAIDVTFTACDTYELKLTVTDTTELVRYDPKFDHIYPKPYREHVWLINQTDVSSYDLSVIISTQNVDCTGLPTGEVSFDNSGGNGPYEIWLDGELRSNPVTDLAAGVYDFVVVDANACSVEESVIIEADEVLDYDICAVNNDAWEVTIVSHNHDLADLDILWSTGATTPNLSGVADGDYSVSVSVNGCEITKPFSLINSDTALSITEDFYASELDRPTGAIYIDVSGGQPDYHIEWSDKTLEDLTDNNESNIDASGTTWDHLPVMAFDDDLGTKWLHAIPSGAWVGYEFDTPTEIAFYAITSADDVPERDPVDWILQGSDDGSSWTDLDTRINEDFPERFQRRAFAINTPQAFARYRLYVTANAGENQVQLQELELIGADEARPFIENTEAKDQFIRTDLAPGLYRYEISDGSAACATNEISIGAYEEFLAFDLNVIQASDCTVEIENPNNDYEYYWLSDEAGTTLLGTGTTFSPPSNGNFYVAAAPSGSNQWSSNKTGFAVTRPDAPIVTLIGDGELAIENPQEEVIYNWYDANACGEPIHTGTSFSPEIGNYYVAAKSTKTYPSPIDPSSVGGLSLRMDAADLNGNGTLDYPPPATSSLYEWDFVVGGNWDPGSYFAYRSNFQNGLGIADWATIWLQALEVDQTPFQTVIMAYQENALSWEGKGPLECLSQTIPRHSDASQIYSNDAPASTLNGDTYLNGELVDPLNTANPMEFCVLGSVFTQASNAGIYYTDVNWEGMIGEILFYDNAISEEEMLGIQEFLRQKWISTADLESLRTNFYWNGNSLPIEESPVNELVIYPNPTSDILTIKGLKINSEIEVFDTQGRIVIAQRNGSNQINVAKLAKGSYVIKIDGEARFFVKL